MTRKKKSEVQLKNRYPLGDLLIFRIVLGGQSLKKKIFYLGYKPKKRKTLRVDFLLIVVL